jgi:hypothetical protein
MEPFLFRPAANLPARLEWMFQTLRQLHKIEKSFEEGGLDIKMKIEVIETKEYLRNCREEEPWGEGKSD